MPDSDLKAASAVPGALHWKDGRAELVLNASFPKAREEQSASYSTVYGTTRTADLVSIHKAIEVRNSHSLGSAGDIQTQELISHIVIIGAHVDATQVYDEITFRIPGLEVWLGGSGLRRKVEGTAETIELPGVQDEVFELPDHDLTIKFRVGRTSRSPSFSQLLYTFPGYLTLRPRAPATLKALLDQFSKVRSLLSTMITSPVFPDWISAKLPGDDRLARVEILVGLKGSEMCRLTSPHDFFISRQHLGTSLPEVLTTWFDGYDAIATNDALAQAVLNSAGLWPHVEFLSYMQVLEGLHRASYAGLYMDPEKYERIAGDLTSQIPPEVVSGHRASLKARLRYGNEISLRNRLKELVSDLPNVICELVLNAGTLPGAWVDTRNYYTHWDQSTKDSIVGGIEMAIANLRLAMLIRVLLLRKAAVPYQIIVNALNGFSKAAQTLKQAKTLTQSA